MAVGEVVFDIEQGCDPDMWDDRALIRSYDRAYRASRELQRRREEGGKRRPITWAVGGACRVLYSDDGLEYEGSIVSLDNARRCAVVRLHGYNQEIEVKQSELEASLGQEAIRLQIEEAAQELGFEEDEEPFEGEVKVGAFCRARWSLDDRVYEGIIEKVLPKQQRVKVRFVGYGNEDTVEMGQLLASKGKEWREGQETDAERVDKEEGDLSLLLPGSECQELLEQLNHTMNQLRVEEVVPHTNKHKKNVEKSSGQKSEKKSKSAGKSRLKESQAAGIQNKKDSSIRRQQPHQQSVSSLTFDHQSPHFLQPMPPPPGLTSQIPPLPPIPPLGSQIPLPPLIPPLPPLNGISGTVPAFLPPPPTLSSEDMDFIHSNSEALHSMLMSWYLAGYHSGYYQGLKLAAKTKSKQK